MAELAFDPDAYLKAKAGAAPAVQQGFDPDAYLKEKIYQPVPRGTPPGMAQSALEHFGNGLSFGYLPQLQAAFEPKIDDALNFVTGNHVTPDDYVKARDANVARLQEEHKANPITSGAANLAGNITGAFATPTPEIAALDAIRGGKIVQGAIRGAAYGGAGGFLSNPGDKPGVFNPLGVEGRGDNAIRGMEWGAPLGAIGGGIQQLAGNLRTPEPNAADITAATRRIGAEPTPGMVRSSETMKDLESSLEQNPSIGGYLVGKKTQPVRDAMQNTAENLVKERTPLSPFEVGEKGKESMSNAVESKFAEPKRIFNDLAQYTKDIPSTDKSTSAVSRNIMNIPDTSIEGTPDASIAKMVVSNLGKNPSADQIKTLKTMVGKKAAAIEDQRGDASGVWDIYHKLSNLEMNTIKRGAIESARTGPEGETIGQGMLGQLKSARAGYRSGMEGIGDLAEASKLGNIKTPGHLVDKLNGINSENFAQKMLPLDDVRAQRALYQYSPETAGLLRQARIGDVADKASDMHRNLTPGGLLRATKDFNPETEQMLFGKGKQSLNDMRAVHDAMPDMVGPSGTPHGMFTMDMLNPVMQAGDLGRYGLYKMGASDFGAGRGDEAIRNFTAYLANEMAKRNNEKSSKAK